MHGPKSGDKHLTLWTDGIGVCVVSGRSQDRAAMLYQHKRVKCTMEGERQEKAISGGNIKLSIKLQKMDC